MRFFASDMYSYRKNVGEVSLGWKETSLSEKNTINKYFMEKLKVFDADNCGSKEVFFAFSSNRYFKLNYEWWIDISSDEYIRDCLYITEIKKEQCKNIASDRDWLYI